VDRSVPSATPGRITGRITSQITSPDHQPDHREERHVTELVVVPILGIGLAAPVFWIWALMDVVKVPDDSMFEAGNKLIWVLVIVLAGAIWAIVYLVVGRPDPSSPGAGGGAAGDRLPANPSCHLRRHRAPSPESSGYPVRRRRPLSFDL
jgi:hypothetical protein